MQLDLLFANAATHYGQYPGNSVYKAQLAEKPASAAAQGLTLAQILSSSQFFAPAPPPPTASEITAELIHEHQQQPHDTGFWERLTERMIGDIDEVRNGMGLCTLHDAAMRRLYNTEIKPVEFVSAEDMSAATRALCRG